MTLLPFYVDDLIKTALREDINYIDNTTDLLIDENDRSYAYFITKAEGVVCGIEIAARVFAMLDPFADIKILAKDGDHVHNGTEILTIHGRTRAMLKAERTALNILQHMSGIATYTNKCAEAIKGTKAWITDTRKTLPGLRPIQKYAVTMGGGKNHRYNLTDAAMLKDNHIDAFGGIKPAVEALRERAGHTLMIEVEARTLDEVKEALEAKADIIMLDNMSFDEMKQACELIDGRAKTEASGNVTLETIRKTAETGVDIISMGALTHSVTAFDISMKWGGK